MRFKYDTSLILVGALSRVVANQRESNFSLPFSTITVIYRRFVDTAHYLQCYINLLFYLLSRTGDFSRSRISHAAWALSGPGTWERIAKLSLVTDIRPYHKHFLMGSHS